MTTGTPLMGNLYHLIFKVGFIMIIAGSANRKSRQLEKISGHSYKMLFKEGCAESFFQAWLYCLLFIWRRIEFNNLW